MRGMEKSASRVRSSLLACFGLALAGTLLPRTREAVEELGLAEGAQVTVLVKSTEVMLGVE